MSDEAVVEQLVQEYRVRHWEKVTLQTVGTPECDAAAAELQKEQDRLVALLGWVPEP